MMPYRLGQWNMLTAPLQKAPPQWGHLLAQELFNCHFSWNDLVCFLKTYLSSPKSSQNFVDLGDFFNRTMFAVLLFLFKCLIFFFVSIELEAAKKDPKFHLKCINSTTMEALKELDDVYKPKVKKKKKKNSCPTFDLVAFSNFLHRSQNTFWK